uniref:(northern house mosquito) hypothetical protein n=1 Tax=Culex pipiens TaxID=7175 RepID=A0A8D8B040_CULPI
MSCSARCLSRPGFVILIERSHILQLMLRENVYPSKMALSPASHSPTGTSVFCVRNRSVVLIIFSKYSTVFKSTAEYDSEKEISFCVRLAISQLSRYSSCLAACTIFVQIYKINKKSLKYLNQTVQTVKH